ncbi:hypothetical protein D3C72_1762690 [compost metagenome]
MHFVLGHQGRQISQGAGKHPLIPRSALLHQRSWRISSTTMTNQFRTDSRQTDQPHIEHQRLRRGDQIIPRQVAGTVLEVARDKAHRLGVITMGQRDPGVGRATTGSGDPRYHLKRNALLGQLFDLFATTAKDKRITAL